MAIHGLAGKRVNTVARAVRGINNFYKSMMWFIDIAIYFTLNLIGLSTNLIYTDKVEKLTTFKSVYHENKMLKHS